MSCDWDNVELGANACELGKITISSNVIIVAEFIEVRVIPGNCAVAGNPARIVKQ